MNLIKLMNKNYLKYLLALGAFIILCYYILGRFLSERLPRDIPYNLSIFSFFILLELTLIFFISYILYLNYPPKKNEFITLMLDFIFIPFDELHNIFRNHFKFYYDKIFIYILNNKNFFINHMNKFYLIFRIIPRYILITTFLVEIIYFKHLEYVYKLLILGVLIFFTRFFIFNIKRFKKEEELEFELLLDTVTTIYISDYDDYDDDDDDDYVYPTMVVPYKDFMEIYVKRYMRDYYVYPFEFSYTIIVYELFKTYTDEQKDFYCEQLSNKFQKYLDASILITHYEKISSKYYVSQFFILFGYFLIWGSLTLLNIHTLLYYR